ncbi:Flp pilus assembly protein CpaB [Roseivivax sp. CAU 1761]
MRMLFALVLIAGVGLAGLAVYMASTYIGAYETALQKERARQAEAVPTREIFVAARTLAYGEELAGDAVKLVAWPEAALPETYFDAATPPVVQGQPPRRVLRAIETHEPLMQVKLSAPGGDAGLTSRLEKGQRAFAIKVDVASGVSGFLRPGDRVDVYWTGRVRLNDPEAPDGDVTKLIQTGVELIAIDQTANAQSTSAIIARTVTVAASPQQVAALAQAQATGRLSLSLMGATDETIAEAIEVDQLSLLGLEKRVAAPRAPEVESCSIRTRRGSEVVEIPIPCTN